MTIICALHAPGEGTWIGGDSRTSASSLVFPIKARKWVRAGQWWVGLTGGSRANMLIARAADRIAQEPTAEDVATLVRQVLRDDGYDLSAPKGEAPEAEIKLLIATSGGIWDVDEQFACDRIDGPFWARGSGMSLAIGAAHALLDTQAYAGEAVIRAALNAACTYDKWCGGDLFVQFLPAE